MKNDQTSFFSHITAKFDTTTLSSSNWIAKVRSKLYMK